MTGMVGEACPCKVRSKPNLLEATDVFNLWKTPGCGGDIQSKVVVVGWWAGFDVLRFPVIRSHTHEIQNCSLALMHLSLALGLLGLSRYDGQSKLAFMSCD